MTRFPTATRESFIPNGSVKVADRRSDAVAYVYTTPRGAPAYAVFYGRQVRPVAHFTARSEAERTRRVTDLFASRQARAAALANHKASQAAEASLIAVGDVLRSSWGYEQTNVNFYQVVGRSGASVTLRPIASEEVATVAHHPDGTPIESMSGHVAPLVDDFMGPAFTKRLTGAGVRISSYSVAIRLEFDTVAGVRVYRRSFVSSYA